MNDINNILTKGYSLKLKAFNKKKSYYICNTNKGLFKLVKSSDTIKTIEFIDDLQEHIKNQSNIKTDNFIVSNSQKPYYFNNESIYILTPYSELRESNYSDANEFKNIIKNLALLHKVLTNVNFKNYKNLRIYDIILDYKKKLVRFESLKKKISQQQKMSDFDVYFIKNFEFYKNNIKQCIERLEKTTINEQVRLSIQKNIVCHGLLKEENIYFDSNNQIHFSGFSEARIEPQLLDLIYILRRYTKTMPQNYLSIKGILEIYTNNIDISDENLKIIYPALSFPNSFLKLCLEYYSKKRTWIPISMLKKMDYIVNYNKPYFDFIDEIKNL